MSRTATISALPKVFIIEDDPSVRDALTAVLSGEGYDVEAFCCGSSFLEVAAPTVNDILVLDLDLPNIHGTEVVEKLKERGPVGPIIVVSGLKGARYRHAVETIDPFIAMRKPLETDAFLKVLPSCPGHP